MKFRNPTRRETLLSIMTLMLFVFGGVMTPGTKADWRTDPSYQQFLLYTQKQKPWYGECRTGATSSCNVYGMCWPTQATVTETINYRIQQCLDNFKRACDASQGTFGFSTTSI